MTSSASRQRRGSRRSTTRKTSRGGKLDERGEHGMVEARAINGECIPPLVMKPRLLGSVGIQ